MKKNLVGKYVCFDDTFELLYKVVDEDKDYILIQDEFGYLYERKEYIYYVLDIDLSLINYKLYDEV